MAGKDLEKTGPAEMEPLDESILKEMEAAAHEQRAMLDLNEDVRLPELRLVQATSIPDGAAPGQLYDTMLSVGYDQLDVIVLNMWKTRARFTGKIGEAPVCTSRDAVSGIGDPGGDCLRCPHAQWRSGGKCQLRFNYMTIVADEGYDPTVEMPRGLMMHGTSAKVASRLNTMLLASKFFWSHVVTLSSVAETNDYGTFRVWDVRRSRPATNEEMLLAFRWHKQVAAASTVTIEGDSSAQSSEAPLNEEEIPF